MFDVGSPVPGLLLASMLFLTIFLLPYIDEPRPKVRDDDSPTEELRLRAEAIARTRDEHAAGRTQR
jgi:hypothetical protein